MKKFLLYGYIKEKPILITDSENITSASSFDEKFSIKENEKIDFNFSIMDILADGSPNPVIAAIYPKAKLTLKVNGKGGLKRYDLVITSLSPEFKEIGTTYSVNAEDWASVVYSKQGQGLSMEMVGEIDELAQEVLFRSRKNLGYLDAAKNFLNFSTANVSNFTMIENQTIKSQTANTSISISFLRSRDMQLRDYTISFNLLGNNDCAIVFQQLDSLDKQISVSTLTKAVRTGLISFTFTLRSTTSRFKIGFNSPTGFVSVGDFKIKKIINSSEVSGSLMLDPNLDKEKFKSQHGSSYFKRVTLSLDNSNLYNALIEVGNLFDAKLFFDYENNIFTYKTSKESKFKGFRLSPYFNLLSLSRSEETSEFSNVLNIRGGDGNFSVFPKIPSAFKDYFYEQIQQDFIGFDKYENIKYADLVNQVQNLIPTGDINAELQKEEILKFATSCDKVPNFDNTLYGLDYFYEIGKITSEQKTVFDRYVNDDLRKINISLRINSELYLNAMSALSFQDTQIEFLTRNIVVEEINLEKINKDYIGVEDNSEKWIALENQKEATLNTINNYTDELLDTMGFTTNNNGDIIGVKVLNSNLAPDSYAANLLNLHGFYNVRYHGISKKLEELKEKRDKEVNEIKEATIRSLQLESELAGNLSSFVKREKEVEKSGLDARIARSRFTIGVYNYNSTNKTWTKDLSKNGSIDYQIQLVELLEQFTGVNQYVPTLINYKAWKLDPNNADKTLDSGWTTISGNVMRTLQDTYAKLSDSDPLIKDYMLRFGANTTQNSVATTTPVVLQKDKNYRFTVLLKGTSVGLTNKLRIELGSGRFAQIPGSILNTGWVLLDYSLTKNEVNIYNTTNGATITYSPADFAFSAVTAITETITPTFRLQQTGSGYSVLFYRPRLTEVSPFDLTFRELISLYDNSFMYGLQETALPAPSTKEGLYDLLYNRGYPNNLQNRKDIVIHNMYSQFEPYVYEGYYENQDEISPEGLMDQALIAHQKSKYPVISYTTNSIDLAAIGYPELEVEVGDLIMISDDPKLYKGYGETTEYLQVSEISYALRKPEEMSLMVSQDDETIKILQNILKGVY